MQVSLPSPRRLFRNRKLKVFELWTLVGQEQSGDKDSNETNYSSLKVFNGN